MQGREYFSLIKKVIKDYTRTCAGKRMKFLLFYFNCSLPRSRQVLNKKEREIPDWQPNKLKKKKEFIAASRFHSPFLSPFFKDGT